ncbi:MAG TPA: hypothetical protein DD473_04855 [Planctomycetaceae bacterium]|nr:hypothetical protein [Planctomycetaceae bacterium]|tara:strand:+ start:134 stop:550 length:417 start_codon:yes stop_codon:yes gene_type:complete
MNRISVYQLIFASFTFVLIGCSGGGEPAGPSKNATVSGKVTSDGKPVSNAVISFEKPAFGAWGADLSADGSYTLELAAGEFNVSITPKAATTTTMDPGNMPEQTESTDIPKKYRSASTSGATATINEGDNTYDLELSE